MGVNEMGWEVVETKSTEVYVEGGEQPTPPTQPSFWDSIKKYFSEHPEMLMFVGMMGMMMFTGIIIALSR